MTHRWQWFLIGGLVAGCAADSSGPATLPDRLDENLDVITRSVSRPCGADADVDGDGSTDVRFTYTYDAQGRSRRDLGIRVTGEIDQQNDYTWDHTGHLTHEVTDYVTDQVKIANTSTFDTLGRRLEFRTESWSDGALRSDSTITYTTFDDLGQATLANQVLRDLERDRSRMQTRTYVHDELGRRIGLDVRDPAGALVQGWQHVYDDAARTITSTMTQPLDAQGNPGFTIVDVASFDADYHLISIHAVSTGLDGSFSYATDTRNEWSGDRQLRSITTSDVFASSTITYTYACD